MSPLCIIGLGNILLRDEGVGVHVINTIKQRYTFSPEVEIIDGGTMGLDLLPYIEGKDKVLIVDAVNLEKEPGTIAVIEDDDIPSFISAKLSVHQIGLPDLLFALKLMDMRPSRMTLIGIQPEKIETGLTLSESINRDFDKFIKTVVDKLRDWAVEVREKRGAPKNPEIFWGEDRDVPRCSF